MMELTEKMIEDAVKCDGKIACCVCSNKTDKMSTSQCVTKLASALQAERAKPKDDVWKNAPSNADGATVHFYNGTNKLDVSSVYSRPLPKTRADELAEELAIEICNMNIVGGETFVTRAGKRIKETILKAQAEWETWR